MRECQRCGETKALSEFPVHWTTGAPIKTCKGCMPQYQSQPTNESRWSRRAWTRRNKNKRRAHKAVEYAVARGELKRQPCERCGTEENVHAHHDDYSRPLDVQWLCHTHHMERHRELRRAAKEAA